MSSSTERSQVQHVLPSPVTDFVIAGHPDLPVIGPLAGAFTWDIPANRWRWTDEMYVIHGFAPHEVVPTTELLLSHKHPEDRAKAEGVVDRFLSTGERFACHHRIIDAQSRERHVLVVAGGATDAYGALTEMSGFMVDLTSSRLADLQPAVHDAVERALEHRGDIEMAKGAIMVGYGITPDEAFAVLCSVSSTSNLKVREVAHRLVAELSSPTADAPASEQILALLTRVTQPDYPGPPST
jgi:hypothetical protein